MKIKYGNGRTICGPGVKIDLSGYEVAAAINAFLCAHYVYVDGPRTIRVNGELIEKGSVCIDPSGFVMDNGTKYSGRGPGADE